MNVRSNRGNPGMGSFRSSVRPCSIGYPCPIRQDCRIVRSPYPGPTVLGGEPEDTLRDTWMRETNTTAEPKRRTTVWKVARRFLGIKKLPIERDEEYCELLSIRLVFQKEFGDERHPISVGSICTVSGVPLHH